MKPLLKLEKISKVYTTNNTVAIGLRNIDLEFNIGEFVTITGSSGSGKTTLMNIIGCLDRMSDGTYLFDNEDISKMNDNALSDLRLHKIGFVFQNFNLLSAETAQENVALPLIYAGVSKE